MKTKLVYVLTCAPEATYIEQALMAVFSARHWNPDAHIVLIVDEKTDRLLIGNRGRILQYITEKIVANTIIDKNQHFSYVVNAKEKNNTTAREIAKIINDDAKLKIGIH